MKFAMSMIEIPPGTTAASATVRSPAAPAMLPAAGPARTLAAAAAGTLLVTAVFSAVVTTVADSARSLHAGVAGETWALSGMNRAARDLGCAWSRWRRRHQARARWHHYHAQLQAARVT